MKKNRIQTLKSLFMMSAFIVVIVFPQTMQAQKKEKKTQNFEVNSIINAPANKVWKVVGEDYGAIANSHPKIMSSNYIDGSLKGGEGAQRVCYFNKKETRYLKEKQLMYNPETYTFKNQVFKAGKFPVVSEYTHAIYKVEAIDETTSQLKFNMTYRTKPAFMGGMMKGAFKKLIANYAIAVDHHVNTGENVTKDNFKKIKKQYKKAKKDERNSKKV